ncbi:hypothetical protein NAPIS_ORF01589 [Vairimorpha apis BRL 01]|uniref:Glutaredoxin domain-containing protein n=1 Tax=Vairimorpha apis BRL 01 TaxID=1037528 RepID=T0MCF7_9MICR|nr:hypothetical protein NAPIS_ORF01588 [Vairimorpha apis BRL 01]EQB60837.1 hypothetical protein NAPIS_ORF01589 [Vairimorpha apis BRL 01]
MNYTYILLINILFINTTTDKPSDLDSPGYVVVASKSCKHSKKLLEDLKKYNIPHKTVFMEDNLGLVQYIKENYNSKVPWLYKDGINVGDGTDFIKGLEQSNGVGG